MRATGTFDVKITPQTDEAPGRMLIEKQFDGDLEGTGKGQMLTAMNDAKESGVYVAIEQVTGSLHGRTGSFALHHTGIMNRGQQQLTITVVPDSGTGDLEGIAGKLEIEITVGKHFYTFEYTLGN